MMARVRLSVDGVAYVVACEDGAEERLRNLADMVDRRAGALRAQGAAGSRRLMFLSALSLADELTQALDRATAAEDLARRLHDEMDAVEASAADAVEAATRRIEAIARRLG